MKYASIKLKRILALILVIAAVLPAAPALAESYKAVVMGGPLTVYEKATLSGKTTTLSIYSVVTVSATKGNVAQLKNGKYTGYANLKNLRPLSEVAIPAVANRSTRVYAQANTSSKSIAIPKGFRLNVLYYNSTYAVVEKDSTVGYAYTAHLTRDTSSQGNITNETGVVTETYAAKVSVSSLPVYKSASTSSQRIATLPAGYDVTVYAQNGVWAYVGRSGNYGFCSLAGLERSAGTGNSALANAVPVTVTAATMKVYQSASTSSKSLGTLRKGAQVNLIKTEGSWAYIELNGNYGYCAVNALTTASAVNDQLETIKGHKALGTATVIKGSAKAYTSMSTSSKSTTLRMGDTISFFGYDSKWVLVGRDNTFGFMLRSDLSAESYAELKLEDSGAGVVQLETALVDLGYLDSVPSSGYTAITAAAVQRLQAAVGMSQTGSADLATLRVLFSGNAPASPLLSVSLSKGSKNANVSRLQARLFALGYLSRESSVDGDYGSNTASAVRLFQTAAGISATGTADSATIRRLYSSSAPALASGQTAPDQIATIPGSSSGSSGNTTSIPAGLASTTSTYDSSMSNAQKLEHVIYHAQLQLGKRYVFGASGPDTFDCSGLMLYCFKRIGISLQHSAQGEGYNDKWAKISSKASLRRGDMVFLNTVNDADLCDHVGIYLGSNYFLHAGSGAGKVIISSLSSGYYSRVFSWGRRVLPT